MPTPQPVSISTSIPLIGQGPTPEEIALAQREAYETFKMWPTSPRPVGPAAGPWWAGETMLHRFAGTALEVLGPQFAARSRTDEELVELCKRAWKIAVFMMQTSPFRITEERPNAASPAAQPDKPALVP